MSFKNTGVSIVQSINIQWSSFFNEQSRFVICSNMLHKESDEAKRQLTKQGVAVGQ